MIKGKWGLKQWQVFVKFGIDVKEQRTRFKQVPRQFREKVGDYMKALIERGE